MQQCSIHPVNSKALFIPPGQGESKRTIDIYTSSSTYIYVCGYLVISWGCDTKPSLHCCCCIELCKCPGGLAACCHTRQLQLKQQMLSCVKMCNVMICQLQSHGTQSTQSRSQDTGHDYDTFISSET